MNRFIGLGRISKEITYKQTPSGTSVTSFSIAINRNFKNKEGNYDADFLQCVSYRNTADFINKYFKKGDMICVDGRVQTRSYEQDGTKRYVTEIVVESAEFCGSKKEDSSKSEHTEIEVPQNYTSQYEGSNDVSIQLSDQDLPF